MKPEILRPYWVKDSMTIDAAAREAYMRGFTLKASWSKMMGLRVIAVPNAEKTKS